MNTNLQIPLPQTLPLIGLYYPEKAYLAYLHRLEMEGLVESEEYDEYVTFTLKDAA